MFILTKDGSQPPVFTVKSSVVPKTSGANPTELPPPVTHTVFCPAVPGLTYTCMNYFAASESSGVSISTSKAFGAGTSSSQKIGPELLGVTVGASYASTENTVTTTGALTASTETVTDGLSLSAQVNETRCAFIVQRMFFYRELEAYQRIITMSGAVFLYDGSRCIYNGCAWLCVAVIALV